jgi:hypothetical protein
MMGSTNMDDPDPHFTSADDDTYVEDRRRRLLRGRLVGFWVCVPLWLLSLVPLARESTDGREGAALVAVYVVVGAITLGVAAVIRGVYVMLSEKRFWSPWLFVLAALVAVVGYTVQSAGEEVIPIVAPARESAAAP